MGIGLVGAVRDLIDLPKWNRSASPESRTHRPLTSRLHMSVIVDTITPLHRHDGTPYRYLSSTIPRSIIIRCPRRPRTPRCPRHEEHRRASMGATKQRCLVPSTIVQHFARVFCQFTASQKVWHSIAPPPRRTRSRNYPKRTLALFGARLVGRRGIIRF